MNTLLGTSPDAIGESIAFVVLYTYYACEYITFTINFVFVAVNYAVVWMDTAVIISMKSFWSLW